MKSNIKNNNAIVDDATVDFKMRIANFFLVIVKLGGRKAGVLACMVLFSLLLAPSFLSAQRVDNPIRYFSPNLDGNKDQFPVPLTIKESDLDKWAVDILRRNGGKYEKIRHYESQNNREGKLTLRKFFSRVFQKDGSVAVPSLVEWGGEDENGQLMSDGEYYLSIYARDRRGNETRSPFIPIFIDTVAPLAEVALADPIFSPNGDGNKEELSAEIALKDFQEFDRRKVEVLNENGEVVHSDETATPEKTWKWDGMTKGGEIPEGRYLLRVTTSDYAGNSSTTPTQAFTLVRTYEQLNFTVAPGKFSPNKDTLFDDVTFTPVLSSVVGLEEWRIDVLRADDPEGKAVKTFTGKALPEKVVFAGIGNDDKPLADGNFFVRFSSRFNSGNTPVSDLVPLRVDTTPPKLTLKADNNVFNPLATSGAKNLAIAQEAIGEASDTYIGLIEDEEKRIVFETNFGSNLPENFVWDGNNSFDQRVAGNYRYSLVGKDDVANVSSETSVPFRMLLGSVDGRLSSSRLAFSPNGDEVKDRTVFLLKFDPDYQEILQSGEITISSDAQGKTVKKSFSLSNYQKETAWNGKDEKGATLPDGEYFFSGDFAFSTGEKVQFAPQPIYIDTVPIQGQFTPLTKQFSPNGDGRLDEYVVENLVKTSAILPDYDTFVVRIEAENGELIRENAWTKDLPKTIRWNGKNQAGKFTKEGVYRYRLLAEDEAGNRSEFNSGLVRLMLTVPSLKIAVSQPFISGRKDAVVTNMQITAQAGASNGGNASNGSNASNGGNGQSATEGISRLAYSVVNDVGEEFLLAERLPVDSAQALPGEVLASPFAWNLVDYEKANEKAKKAAKKNFILPSGKYSLRLKAEYDSGLVAISNPIAIIIDNESPVAGVGTRPPYFSPDNDGENEELTLRFLAEDNDAIVSSKAELFRRVALDAKGKAFAQTEENYKNNYPAFKNFKLANKAAVDETIVWNGVGDGGELVESANDYMIFFTVTDRVGLVTQAVEPILVDIFIEKLSDGRLKIVINSINFQYNSDKMIGEYQDVLNRLVRMLGKFPTYEILVTGHTDSRGSEKYNDNLSLKRAKRVYNYLTSRAGIPKKQVTFEGRGESELFIKEEVVTDARLDKDRREYLTEDNYRKNRRVEFFLTEKEKSANKK